MLRSLAAGTAMFLICMTGGDALAGSEPYRVGPGDTLLVTTYGDAGLTGQFVVSADGSIGFPLLGNVDVLDRTTVEINEQLNKALAQYLTDRRVTVTIAAYAPVYAVGDVDHPGKYEYHPGMTSLELLAMSGGNRRGKDLVDGAQIQLVTARQEYADLALQVFSNQVRHARLEAELGGKEFSYAIGDGFDATEQELKEKIVASEKTLFDIRRANLASQKVSLENQQASYLDEVKALEARTELHDNEIALLEEDVKSTTALVEKGLTSKANLREIERQLSAARRDSLEMGSYLARARQGALDIAQRIEDLTETMRADAAKEIRELDLDTIRKQKLMSATLDRMAAITDAADALKAKESRARLVFEIVRPAEDGFQRIEAEELTELKPRDVLRATLTLPDSVANVATTTGSVE